MQAHDHNFKNDFLDFPKEALSWLLPEALQAYGQLERIEFVRTFRAGSKATWETGSFCTSNIS